VICRLLFTSPVPSRDWHRWHVAKPNPEAATPIRMSRAHHQAATSHSCRAQRPRPPPIPYPFLVRRAAMTAQPASALVPILAQHIKGKTILVLGASPNSLGARFLEAIKPAEPGLVILGLRNETKATEVASTLSPIPTRTFPVDFASFANVRTAAQQVLAMDDQIDVLVNNIGTMASPYYKTEDGFESQLQLNHLSFFLFTNLIMDKLIASKTRIVNITSEGYSLGGIRYHDWNFHVSTAAVSTSTHGRLRL
jgi:hypothetical protein